MNGFSKTFRIVVIAAPLALPLPSATRAQQAPLQDKPFAEHKIVLQLSDNDPRKQGLVISVASNLMKLYDPDKVAIEVVAFGPGIELLRTRKSQPQSRSRAWSRRVCASTSASTPSTPSNARPASGRTSCPPPRRCRSASRRYCS